MEIKANSPRPGAWLPEDLRNRLNHAHASLLRVHKALLDHERQRFERANGPISGPGEFLQLVITDPWFAWLRSISELAVQIDELLSSKQPGDPRAGETLLNQARELIVPNEGGNQFQRNYYRSLQESPNVVIAHTEWKQSNTAWN